MEVDYHHYCVTAYETEGYKQGKQMKITEMDEITEIDEHWGVYVTSFPLGFLFWEI